MTRALGQVAVLLVEWRAQEAVGCACLTSAANLVWRSRGLYRRGGGGGAVAPRCVADVFADAGSAMAGAHAREVERALCNARGVLGSLGDTARDIGAAAAGGRAEYLSAMRAGGGGGAEGPAAAAAAAAIVASSPAAPVPVVCLAEWLSDAARWVAGEHARKAALLEALAAAAAGGGGGGEGEGDVEDEEEDEAAAAGTIVAVAAAWPDARGAACADGTPMASRVAEVLRLVVGDAVS